MLIGCRMGYYVDGVKFVGGLFFLLLEDKLRELINLVYQYQVYVLIVSVILYGQLVIFGINKFYQGGWIEYVFLQLDF